jgi:hypothetical protein
MAETKTILLMAANPKDTVNLRLQQEEREIKERLRLAGYGKVPIYSTGATRTRDIQQAMLDFSPQVVHFSGHGAGQAGLVFEDMTGSKKLVDARALAGLFKLFEDQVECVVLNACYSEVQAKAISKHVNYVVGMSQSITDEAAIEFSVGFYTALGAGKSYEFAYRMGCNAIHLAGIPESSNAILIKGNTLTSSGSKTNEVQKNGEIARYKNYIGLYEGQALNITMQGRGRILINVFDIDSSSHKVRGRLDFSQGLYAGGNLYGSIDHNDVINISGTIVSEVTGAFDADVRFHFIHQRKIQGTYRVYPHAGNPNGTQDGEFTADKI